MQLFAIAAEGCNCIKGMVLPDSSLITNAHSRGSSIIAMRTFGKVTPFCMVLL